MWNGLSAAFLFTTHFKTKVENILILLVLWNQDIWVCIYWILHTMLSI